MADDLDPRDERAPDTETRAGGNVLPFAVLHWRPWGRALFSMIEIEGMTWEVVATPEPSEEAPARGACHLNKHRIALSTRETGSTNTLLRELLEAGNDAHEWRLEHKQLSSIATFLVGVLRPIGWLPKIVTEPDPDTPGKHRVMAHFDVLPFDDDFDGDDGDDGDPVPVPDRVAAVDAVAAEASARQLRAV